MVIQKFENALGIKMDIGLWLIFGGTLILLVWFLLKLAGIINTPFIVQAIPYLTGAGVILGFGVQSGKFLQQLNSLVGEFRDVKHDVRRLETDMLLVKGKLHIRA